MCFPSAPQCFQELLVQKQMQINTADDMVTRDGCWKGIYSEFIKYQFLCTLLELLPELLVEQQFVSNGQSELTLFPPKY